MLPQPHTCRRILLAEDNRDDAFLFTRAAKRQQTSVEVILADDGAEAQSLLSAALNDGGPHWPDILVTDLKMPSCDGIELVQWVRQQAYFADLRVIMLTSSEEPADIERAYEAGADAYLLKPASVHSYDEVLRCVVEFCGDPAFCLSSTLVRRPRTAVARPPRPSGA